MWYDPWSYYVKVKLTSSLIYGENTEKHVRVIGTVTFNWKFTPTVYNCSLPRLLCSKWIEGNRVI